MSNFAMSLDPLLPWPFIGALALLLAVVIAALGWRRVRGTLLRAVASALLVAALANPVLQREERDPLPGVIALVVDASASQRLGNRTAQTEATVAALKQRLEALGGFEVREVHAPDRPDGDGTALFSELTDLVDDVPPEQIAGAVLVTDGIVADVPKDPAALGFDAPVHALITGEEGERDRRIVLERAPRFAILGEEQSIQYRVVDPDVPPGTDLAVRLRIDGTEVATDMVTVGESHVIDVPLTHAGRSIVELEVDTAEGELAAENNVAVAEIDVVREHLRVLLVSGEPHAGERTWRNVLKSDAAVDLVHFTILRPPEKQDGTPINELSLIAFPTRELFEEKIDQFDLIIFDRYQSRGVLPIVYYDNLANYVRNGGAVLVAAGPDYASSGSLYRTPLGPVLPAVPTGERTWRNVLKSDAAVDLVHFTILRPPEKQDGTPINELSLIAFPTRELFEEKIDQFDLIIFDRYQSRGVLPIVYYDNLARYVREGGAVLVAAGPDYASSGSLYRTPLGPVLPAVPTGQVIEAPYKAVVSPVGMRHPVTRDLPGGDTDPPAWSSWFRLVDTDAIAGDITMTGAEGRPLLVLAREGEGRVAMMLSDHAWLWARGYDGGGPHAALLRRLLHWLMREPELEEEALTAHAEGRDLVVERQTLSENAPTVTVTGPTGEPEPLTLAQAEPGLWRGAVKDARLGLHRAEDGTLTALAHIGPANPAEFQDVISTTERLQPVADATGGSVRRVGGGDIPRLSSVSSRAPASGRDWIGFRRSEATVLRSVDQLPLLGGLLGLALLVGAFSALWYREAR